ncbi:MAG: AAA family ATPase [Clostridiales bacterium]|nr:AAA family ATPase [Clostridiales bacterium]
MKIDRLKLDNFMLFNDLDIKWSKNINIISGENSTGKTTLLKAMYSAIQPISNINFDKTKKEKMEELIVEKFLGVFRPDEMKLGRLVTRKPGSNRAELKLFLEDNNEVAIGFGNRQERHADVEVGIGQPVKKFTPVYLPPKEMISSTEHFRSLYEEYHLDFEEMYYDLSKLLDKPLKRGANTTEQNNVLSSFEKIIDGKIIQRDKKFYLKMKGEGEFEMGLVSEGYRKLATIIYLITSGSLGKNSILFWDEPETNMNPIMMKTLADAMMELAGMGVQIFITTHDYFVQQCFNFPAAYPKANHANLNIKFISLYEDEKDKKIKYELCDKVSELEHNSIMREFESIYDREQELIYED